MLLGSLDKPTSRFDYAANLAQTGKFAAMASSFWPPASSYELHNLRLAPSALGLSALNPELARLRKLIDAEWQYSKSVPEQKARHFSDVSEIAKCLRALGDDLPKRDCDVLNLRADCVESGYADERVAELMRAEENVAIVAGQISTWFGKEVRPRPTAFGSVRDGRLSKLLDAGTTDRTPINEYLSDMHKALVVRETPNFVPSTLFFMAGEGNLHPKHIAYFLPEDEGVKCCPTKKTYYFANTHAVLVRNVGLKLLGRVFPKVTQDLPDYLPPVGVLAHEVGHFVLRNDTSFTTLNRKNRWVSVVLQEAAADVFGTLIMAEIWAERFGITAEQVISYHLSECLRYVCRGLGLFPDSDGMFLQLSFFSRFDAIRFDEETKAMTADTEGIIACLRAMARVLADTLLYNRPEDAIAFHDRFGPGSKTRLDPMLAALQDALPYSVKYVQDETTI